MRSGDERKKTGMQEKGGMKSAVRQTGGKSRKRSNA